jgi:DNA replication and repair protein RecF
LRINRLWLTDFRSFEAAEVAPATDGLTVIQGDNGVGKTNLLEAVGYLATMSSFRGAPHEALVRAGSQRAAVRAEVEREQRNLLIEVDIPVSGRERAQINRQPLRRARDLLGALRVSVFSPDDLVLVKGAPSERRRFLDDALVALQPRFDQTRGELERALRQRASLLKQGGPQPDAGTLAALEVWDAKLAEIGEAVATSRARLVVDLEPEVAKSYARLAGEDGTVVLTYRRSWEGPLDEALTRVRSDDLRRGITSVGPHRDDLLLELGGLPARSHASQGEQRTLALALRLAVHGVVADTVGSPPVLLLDDVFSELDAARSEAVMAHLPGAQALLTTVSSPPPGVAPARTVRVTMGAIVS